MALATFFYGFDGPSWPITTWLDPTKSECLWLSRNVENEAEVYMSGNDNYSFDTCNEDGQIQAILLNGLGLEPGTPRLPKELVFLSSLQSIQLSNNGISTSFEEMLELRLNRLEGLQDLSLHNNSFFGPLPRRLKWFTSLKRLQLQNNKLTGTISSELSALTNLEYLILSHNSLTGELPSEVGLLTSLKVLDISHNSIAGAIPEEVLALQTKYNLTIIS